MLALLVPLVSYDPWSRRGRIHPALAWGGLIFILLLPARLWLKRALG